MTRQAVSSETTLEVEVREAINELLADYFKRQSQQASAMAIQYGRLWETMQQLGLAGGKRLRPYMVILAYRSLGGKDWRSMLPVAAAWELLHFCLLIHDDIIDNDTLRYGVKNISGSYQDIYSRSEVDIGRQAHAATSAALLAGDLALSAAHELILGSALPPGVRQQVLRYLTQATFTVAGGELLDTEAALYPVMEADPLLIARLKTASYTFVGPLVCGAAMAGAPETVCKDMEQLGEVLGCAYQLQDDLIGVFGDSLVTGKSVSGDISEGKRTVLLQQAFIRASDSDRERLGALVGKPDLGKEELGRVRDIIVSSGAKRQVEAMITAYATTARSIVEGIDMPADARGGLIGLVTRTTERDY